MARAGRANTQMGTDEWRPPCLANGAGLAGGTRALHSLTRFSPPCPVPAPAPPHPAPPCDAPLLVQSQVPIQEASRVLKRPEMLAALAAMASTTPPGDDAL